MAGQDEQDDLGIAARAAELRQRAEDLAAHQETTDPADLSVDEIRRLVHDLHVHQIQLEMQNDELRRTQIELNAARARYFDMYDLAPVGYLTIDQTGSVLEANLRAAALLGMPRTSLALRAFTSFIDPADQDVYYLQSKRLLETGQPIECELRLKRADGSRFWARLEANLVRDPPDAPRLSRCTLIDISERREAEDLLRDSKEEVEKYNRRLRDSMARTNALTEQAERVTEAKSRYLTSISHEIRTPLNGLLGVIDLLRDTLLDDEQRELITLAHSSGQGLRRIIDDVLDFSKLEAGKVAVEAKDFDLRALMEQIVLLLEVHARQRRLTLTWRADDSVPPLLRGDPGRIRQVLLNLVDNALKYTERGGVVVRIAGRPRDEGGIEARVEVQDTGVGVRPEKACVLFRPFEQADAATLRPSGGTGLGLAICKRLVELMGGAIGYAPRETGGSVFWFTLPLGVGERRASMDGVTATERDLAPAPVPARGGGPLAGKVLLVEDDADSRFVAVRMLGKLGVRVDVAANGREAIRALESARYDVVLMDLQMPEMGGLEAALAIRSRSTGALDPEVPIIALTAHNLEGDRERSLAAGANDHLAKPIDRASLAALLGKWLDRPAA